MATAEQVKFYDEFLPHFESQVNNARNIGFRQLTRWAIQNVCKTKTPRVLDIGCAFGYNSEYLHREFPGSKVHGVDLSPRCIEEAKKRFPHGRWECTDFTEWEPEDDKVDLVLMSDVLEHIPSASHEKVFSTIACLTHPASVIVISTPIPHVEQIAQPVEEPIRMLDLLKLLDIHLFRTIHYVDRTYPYQRLVIQGEC